MPDKSLLAKLTPESPKSHRNRFQSPENERKTGETNLVQADRAQGKRGRKPAGQSRAEETRTKLLAWRQTPEAQRISLRALASELGASHQLLSFHLRRLDAWQMKEYRKREQEIRSRVIAERRSITPEEEMRCAAYARASFMSMD